ncbi:MAG: D-tyrosyl-tRNA(Tyr) deacylase [Lachnospiraceae bacterium]|nr:D-tyrosyl-tRNA(Tyr) deacylase [Lachnospiraceae bacterium]
MRLVIQRVNHASVKVDGVEVGAIGTGYLVFLGVADSDTKEMAERYARKLSTLRIFPDAAGKINRSIQDVQGQILVVSQFTLYADCKKGNRPSFVKAGAPEKAEALYEYFIECCKALVPGGVESGSFGADMKVSLENDGPFTVLWDSAEW